MDVLQNDYTIHLVNTFITSHNYIFCGKVSLSNFQVHNTVVFTIVSRLCIRFSELISELEVCIFDQHFPISPTLQPP